MAKLKCWRKVGKDSWKKKKFTVRIVRNQLKQDYSVQGNGRDLNINDFKKKSQATKFTQNWLRKHDKC